jgi:hypothetical protein
VLGGVAIHEQDAVRLADDLDRLDAIVDRERYAYEVLLNKFDVLLERARASHDSNRGLVIHDRRIVAERDIQEWTRRWQTAAGSIGQIHNLADVPFFADSRASRLLQAADLVSYALYRHYDPARQGDDYAATLWPRFDAVGTAMHGCVHFTPSFGAGVCRCRPCRSRLGAGQTSMLQAEVAAQLRAAAARSRSSSVL